jgi:hypothetical protein
VNVKHDLVFFGRPPLPCHYSEQHSVCDNGQKPSSSATQVTQLGFSSGQLSEQLSKLTHVHFSSDSVWCSGHCLVLASYVLVSDSLFAKSYLKLKLAATYDILTSASDSAPLTAKLLTWLTN